jgi:hypothetical protein
MARNKKVTLNPGEVIEINFIVNANETQKITVSEDVLRLMIDTFTDEHCEVTKETHKERIIKQ